MGTSSALPKARLIRYAPTNLNFFITIAHSFTHSLIPAWPVLTTAHGDEKPTSCSSLPPVAIETQLVLLGSQFSKRRHDRACAPYPRRIGPAPWALAVFNRCCEPDQKSDNRGFYHASHPFGANARVPTRIFKTLHGSNIHQRSGLEFC